MTKHEVEHGRGYVIAYDTGLSDEVSKKISERSTHLYRDGKGNIINWIKCEGT